MSKDIGATRKKFAKSLAINFSLEIQLTETSLEDTESIRMFRIASERREEVRVNVLAIAS